MGVKYVESRSSPHWKATESGKKEEKAVEDGKQRHHVPLGITLLI